MRSLWSRSIAVVLTLAAPAWGAKADDEAGARARREPPVRARLEAASDAPLDVGVRASIEAPARVRFSSSIGVLPQPYVDAVGGALDAMNAGPAGSLVRRLLQDSLVWRTHVGWRPLARAGWYVDAGYGLVSVGGTARAADLLSLDQAVSFRAGPSDTVAVHSTIHMLDVETGWEWLLADRLYLRAAAGAALTVGAASSIDPTLNASYARYAREVSAAGSGYLDHIYRTYFFTPVVSIGVGWALF